MGRPALKLVGFLALVMSHCCLGGCSSSNSSAYVVPLTESEKKLTKIAMAFTDYSSKGKPPKDVDELKETLKNFGNPDEFLTSPSDGLPYLIIWGKNPTGGPGDYKGMFPILAYEQKGQGGQRAVVDIRARPMTVPDEDFLKLNFIGGHKPALN